MQNGSAAILYLSSAEKFGQSTAATQYFLKMAGFLGIPVIAWNADNTGLEKVERLMQMLFPICCTMKLRQKVQL